MDDNPCPRCIRDSELSAITVAYLEEVASAIPEDKENMVAKTVYKKRLDECLKCDALVDSVMCSWCGCYVILRAKFKKNKCPYPKSDKWVST